jgi:hypothetical protein
MWQKLIHGKKFPTIKEGYVVNKNSLNTKEYTVYCTCEVFSGDYDD